MKGQHDSKTMCQNCHQFMSEEIYWNHIWDCKIHRMFIKEVFYGFECKLCSFESDGCGMMMRHMKQIHSKQILLNWTTIRNGIKMFHRKEKINGARKYFCKFCPEEKSREVEIIFHLKEFHTNEIREINSNPLDPKNQAILKDLNEKKSKKIKRRFDREVGLLRRLHEKSYRQAKQAAAAKTQELKREQNELKKRLNVTRNENEQLRRRLKNILSLKNEEKGDINSRTVVNVVTSIRSNQMIFEIEEASGGNDLGVDTSIHTDTNDEDVEMTEEPEKKKAEISDEKMFEDLFIDVF